MPSRADQLHEARLLGRSQPDEERDENQKRIEEEAQEREHESHPLADGGGRLGGPDVIGSHGQHGTQDPAAVHRERRQQVEGCQRHVDPKELVEKAATDTHHFLEALESPWPIASMI